MKGTVIYHYIGNGASLPGIPTRDLSESEAMEYGVALLLGSGLYRRSRHRNTAPDDDYFDNLEVENGTRYQETP